MFKTKPDQFRVVVGDIGGVPIVASPMYKQHFRLSDGVCVEDPTIRLPVHAVRIEHGDIFIAIVQVA